MSDSESLNHITPSERHIAMLDASLSDNERCNELGKIAFEIFLKDGYAGLSADILQFDDSLTLASQSLDSVLAFAEGYLKRWSKVGELLPFDVTSPSNAHRLLGERVQESSIPGTSTEYDYLTSYFESATTSLEANSNFGTGFLLSWRDRHIVRTT
jgi:hypothetical protein